MYFFKGIDQTQRTWIFHGEEEEAKINEDKSQKRSYLKDISEFDDYLRDMVEDAMNDQLVNISKTLHELLSNTEK